MTIDRINISPQRNDPTHNGEEKALIVSPSLGDRLGVATGRLDTSIQDIASRVMGISPYEFQSSTEGQQYQKMMEPLCSLFDMMDHLDLTGDFGTLLQKGFAEATDTLEQNMRQQLVVAHVHTASQLRAKTQHIAQVKDAASRIFYSTPEMIDQCVTADLSMTRSACGEVSEQNRNTIQAYWSLISKSPNGFQIHENIQSMALKPLLDSLPDMMRELEKKGNQGMSYLDNAKSIVAILNSTAEKAQTSLLDQLRKSSDESSIIQLKYCLLRQTLTDKSMFNFLVKKFVEQIARQLEETVNNEQLESKLLDLDLKFFKEDIVRYEKYLQAISEDKKSPDTESWKLEYLEKDEARYRKYISELEENISKFEAYKKSPGAYLKWCHGDPADIYALIPPLTSHDEQVVKLFAPQLQTMQLGTLPAMTCEDIQLCEDEISAQYFMQKMQTEVEAREKAFTALADRVELASS